MISEVFQTLGIAPGLGLLVGLQRERSHSRWAGIRTFPLITLLGTICGLLSANLGGWIIATARLLDMSQHWLNSYFVSLCRCASQ